MLNNESVLNHFVFKTLQFWIKSNIFLIFTALVTIIAIHIYSKTYQRINQNKKSKEKIITIKNQLQKHEDNLQFLISSISKLQQLKQDFSICYNFYKQVLYIKAKMYPGTNLSSLLSLFKSQQQYSTEFKSFNKFESATCHNLFILTLSKMKQMSQLKFKVIQILQRGYLQIKQSIIQSINPISISNNKFSLEDLLKYNLSLKLRLNLIKKQSIQFDNVSQFPQIPEHQVFLQITKNAIFFSSELSNLLIYMIKSFVQIKFSGKLMSLMETVDCPLLDVKQNVCKIANQILRLREQKQSLSKQQEDNEFVILKNFIKKLKEIIDNKKFQQSLDMNQADFFNEELGKLQDLLQFIKNFKIKLYNLKHEKNKSEIFSEKKINIYTSCQQQQVNCFANYGLSTSKDIQQSNQSNAAFSPQDRLSFIKKLDQLMIRNQIRKQQEEMNEALKQRQFILKQSLGQQINQVSFSANQSKAFFVRQTI